MGMDYSSGTFFLVDTVDMIQPPATTRGKRPQRISMARRIAPSAARLLDKLGQASICYVRRHRCLCIECL